jgi:hypothetical protein
MREPTQVAVAAFARARPKAAISARNGNQKKQKRSKRRHDNPTEDAWTR